MRHVSIGFLPEGFHPLQRFLSLSNRQERPAANSIVCSKRVRSSGTAYRAKTVSSDSTHLSEVGLNRYAVSALLPERSLSILM